MTRISIRVPYGSARVSGVFRFRVLGGVGFIRGLSFVGWVCRHSGLRICICKRCHEHSGSFVLETCSTIIPNTTKKRTESARLATPVHTPVHTPSCNSRRPLIGGNQFGGNILVSTFRWQRLVAKFRWQPLFPPPARLRAHTCACTSAHTPATRAARQPRLG